MINMIKEKTMHIQSRWTVVFLLLAAAAFAIAAIGSSLTVWAWAAGGLFVVLAFLFAVRTYSQTSQKPVWRILLLTALLILAIMAATLFSFLRYHPALEAAPGYTMHHVTDPGWLNGRFKTVQAIVEYVPCTYTLLGWQDESALYYQSTCGDREQLWRYDLAAEKVEKASAPPNELYTVPTPFSTIIDNLIVTNIYPPELATVSQQTFSRGEPMVSENGRYTAFISQHVYGPQDVMILIH